MTIELLEARIAPASVVNLIDNNGDHLKFTASHGDLAGKVTSAPGIDTDHNVYTVDLSDAAFNSADFSVTVKKAGGGDGVVDVGYINAGTNNLGKVNIAGNLGHIDAGHGSATVAAIKSLTVGSMGRFGLTDYSTITGTLGSLKVKGDVFCKQFTATQDIQSVTIGGSLVGGDGQNDGEIFAAHNFLKATIGGDVVGGQGDFSGELGAGVDMGKITIKGSIIGGDGRYSGVVGSGRNVASVMVAGSVIGGKGNNSGNIIGAHSMDGKIDKVSLGGSLVGGDGAYSGTIGGVESGGPNGYAVSLGVVTIKHDIVGGNGFADGSVYAYRGTLDKLMVKGSLYGGSFQFAGFIGAATHAGSVSIGGNLYGGNGDESAYILANSIDRLMVGGSLFGASGNYSANIEAGTLGYLKIGHDVRGGSGENSAAVRASGGITTQVIGGLVIPGTGVGSGQIG